MDLLRRCLPQPPASILDVGGGPGRYARVLGEMGYQVELVDPVELHVEQARPRGVTSVLETPATYGRATARLTPFS